MLIYLSSKREPFRKTITFSCRSNIQVSRIDHHHSRFIRRSFSANGISLTYAYTDAYTDVSCPCTHAGYTPTSPFLRRAVPGLTWFFAGVQLWRLCLPARVHSRFCRGNSLSSKRERNLRWISIGSRRAPPVAKRPCSIAIATGYRGPTIVRGPVARRALNFDPANLACRRLTASIGPSSATWFFIVAFDHSRLFLLSMKWFINNVSAFLRRDRISASQ